MRPLLSLSAAIMVSACALPQPLPPAAAAAGDVFWASLTALCGQAFEGRMIEGTAAGDAAFGDQHMVMHVRECGDREIKIPFHVGDNRSRTWVLTRLPDGHLRLKHDHRHADGSEEEITQYGGDTAAVRGDTLQEFHADALTAQLVPAAATNIWTMAVDTQRRTFTYALRREAELRRFRVDFDLTQPVTPPPPPWGYE
jgi:hypothetical protein